jgi:hypothetical protein
MNTLIEVIDRLDQVDDSDRFNPRIIFAEGESSALPTARALVCPGDEEGTRQCPLDSTLREVLLVWLAKEAIQVWSFWRGGRLPNAEDKFEAVVYYSRNDAYLPVKRQV